MDQYTAERQQRQQQPTQLPVRHRVRFQIAQSEDRSAPLPLDRAGGAASSSIRPAQHQFLQATSKAVARPLSRSADTHCQFHFPIDAALAVLASLRLAKFICSAACLPVEHLEQMPDDRLPLRKPLPLLLDVVLPDDSSLGRDKASHFLLTFASPPRHAEPTERHFSVCELSLATGVRRFANGTWEEQELSLSNEPARHRFSEQCDFLL